MLGELHREDGLVDEPEEKGKGEIRKDLALQMNVDFLLKVTGMHWRVLSSEVA